MEIVQSANSGWVASTVASFTVTLSSAPQQGHMLVAFYGGLTNSESNPVVPPSGFSQVVSVQQANVTDTNFLQSAVASRLVQSGDGTTWTFTNSTPANGAGNYGVGAVIFEVSAAQQIQAVTASNDDTLYGPVTISTIAGSLVFGTSSIFTAPGPPGAWSIGSDATGGSSEWSITALGDPSLYASLAVAVFSGGTGGSVTSELVNSPVNSDNNNWTAVIVYAYGAGGSIESASALSGSLTLTPLSPSTPNASSLAGWFNSNNPISVDSTFGNPAPSLTGTAAESYCIANLGAVPTQIKVQLYALSGNLNDFFFCCNADGAGQMVRNDTRGDYSSGIAATQSWDQWDGPSSGSSNPASAWNEFVIDISGDTATLTINGTLWGSYTMSTVGTYIGLQSDALTNSGNPVYWANLSYTLPEGLEGGISSASELTGNLAIAGGLAGSSSSTSTLSGDLKLGTLALTGSVSSISGLTGNLAIAERLAGVVRSTSTLAGDLGQRLSLVGTAASRSALTGELKERIPLTGSTHSTSTLAGDLGKQVQLAGTAASASLLRGTIAVGLAGVVKSTSDLTGTVAVRLPLAGSIESASDMAGRLTERETLAASIESASDLRGTLKEILPISGTWSSTSAVSGTLALAWELRGALSSISALSASLSILERFSGGITSSSTLGASATVRFPIAGSIGSVSSLTGNLGQYGHLVGRVYSTSLLVGNVPLTVSAALGQAYAQPATLIFPAHVVNPNEPGYAFLARSRSARAIAVVTVAVTPPPQPGPPPGPGEPPSTLGINLSPIWRVSETYDSPTIISGLPYSSSSREPWQPASVQRDVWAMQLQILISGQDVTYFRNLPTEVQSWSSQEPFGDASATLVLPGVTSYDMLPTPAAVATGANVGIAATYTGKGYWLAAAEGLVAAYGDAAFYGDPFGLLNMPASSIASHPTEYGYAVAAEDGGVFAFGGVAFHGSLPGIGVTPSAPIVGITITATGNGYWLLGADGSVYSFGDAQFYGTADVGWPTNDAVGITRSGGGDGYVILSSNGGVFAFGDATFYGSVIDSYVAPFVGISTAPGVDGYLIINSLGDAYAFGSVAYEGGTNYPLNQPMNSVTVGPGGDGYWMSALDGGIFTFGDAQFYGSAPGGGIVAEGSLSWMELGAPLTINRVLPPPSSPSVTPVGAAGTTTYDYVITAQRGAGETLPSAPGQTTTGVATLSTTDYNSLSWAGTSDAESYGVYRYSATTQTYQLIGTASGTTFDDTGQAPSTQTPPTSPSMTVTLFEGVIADWDDNLSTGSEVGLQIQCVGCLFQLDWYLAKPTINLPFMGYSPTSGQPVFGWDVGDAIAQAINSTIDPSAGTALGTGPLPTFSPAGSAFNGHFCTPVQTGIPTTTIGTWNAICSGYLSSMLASAQTAGGAQWTVAVQRPRTPVIVQKNLTSVNWTVATGGHGISHQLALDLTGAANAIYGQGTTPPSLYVIGSQGNQPMEGQWQNEQYPRMPPPLPAFPLSEGDSFVPGSSTTGFLPFSSWMRISGYPLVSQDTYLANDIASVTLDVLLIEAWQQQAGLEVTGKVDKATWDAAFGTGENEGGVSNVWFAPLWQLPDVEPFTYTPSGAPTGLNPAFNPRVPRIERFEQMGSQLMKSQGILSAIVEGAQIQIPSWNGTITLAADPEEGSRFDIVAGQNILLRFFHGRDTMFHISAVSVSWTDLTVQLTVSSQALDLATLAAIWARDNQALGPSRQARPSLANLNMSTAGTVFDAESGAGVVPPTDCPAGGWVVVKVPMEESGSVALTSFTASPATPFAVGVFSGPVTASNIQAAMGPLGPLEVDPLGNNPWNDYAYTGANGGPGLYNYGLLYGAGGLDGACGYYPSDPTAAIQTLTGRYVDGQTWPFASAPGYAPWLWVAFWATAATTISGQMLPAPPTQG